MVHIQHLATFTPSFWWCDLFIISIMHLAKKFSYLSNLPHTRWVQEKRTGDGRLALSGVEENVDDSVGDNDVVPYAVHLKSETICIVF